MSSSLRYTASTSARECCVVELSTPTAAAIGRNNNRGQYNKRNSRERTGGLRAQRKPAALDRSPRLEKRLPSLGAMELNRYIGMSY